MNLKDVEDFYQSLAEVKKEINEFSSVAVCELDGGIMDWVFCKGSICDFMKKQEKFVRNEFAQNFPSSVSDALKIPGFDFNDFAKLLLQQKQLVDGNEKKLWYLVQNLLNYPPCEKLRIGKEFFMLLEEEKLKPYIDENRRKEIISSLVKYN